MKKRPLRIVAALLLVVALLTLSGLTATASILIGSAAPHSCCYSDRGATPTHSPCSSPDCTCFSCISMMIYPPLTPQRDGDAERLPLTTPKRHSSSAYVHSIDYPPRTGVIASVACKKPPRQGAVNFKNIPTGESA